jgi:peptidoglycan/xylan/chitin deacetylase (PgdA/CDA1 family)
MTPLSSRPVAFARTSGPVRWGSAKWSRGRLPLDAVQMARYRPSRMSKTERFARFADITGVAGVLRRLGAWTGVLVFNYHRIGCVDGSYDAGIWDAAPATFEQQVRLLEREFDVISPVELEAAVRGGTGRYVMLTFDDGYRDNFTEALPVLRAHGLPATFFVTTRFLDTRQIAWWDEIAWIVHAAQGRELNMRPWVKRPLSIEQRPRQDAVRTLIGLCSSLPQEEQENLLDRLAEAAQTGRHRPGGDFWMTWDQVRELRAAGMHIGGHSVSHPQLAALSTDAQYREITGCQARLEAELGEPMRYFSYPFGSRESFAMSTREILDASGVELAFSFYGGSQRCDDWDRLDVRRCCVGATVSAERFALMVTMPQVFARPKLRRGAGSMARRHG